VLLQYPDPLLRAYRGEGLIMQAAIGYVRVSTCEQGRSGLGLAAQRHEIERFASLEGLEVRRYCCAPDGATITALSPSSDE